MQYNTMMGREAWKQHCLPTDTVSFANELNQFYNRFEKDTYGDMLNNVCRPLWDPITLTEGEIAGSLAKIRPHKPPGPDGLRGRAITWCIYQLQGVFTRLFQGLLDVCHSHGRDPQSFQCLKSPYDFRLIALTSILCKHVGRVILGRLTSPHGQLDNPKFAYKAQRGAEDVTLMLLHMVTTSSILRLMPEFHLVILVLLLTRPGLTFY